MDEPVEQKGVLICEMWTLDEFIPKALSGL